MRMYGLGRTSGGYIKKDIEAWLAADLNWETMDEEEAELYPGIRVLNFGSGHAYGMMGLLVTCLLYTSHVMWLQDSHALTRI